MTTEKQKRAVAFCRVWCDEKYDGDPEDFKAVSEYLSRNLHKADRAAHAYAEAVEEREREQSYRRSILRSRSWFEDYENEIDWDALRNDIFI